MPARDYGPAREHPYFVAVAGVGLFDRVRLVRRAGARADRVARNPARGRFPGDRSPPVGQLRLLELPHGLMAEFERWRASGGMDTRRTVRAGGHPGAHFS